LPTKGAVHHGAELVAEELGYASVGSWASTEGGTEWSVLFVSTQSLALNHRGINRSSCVSSTGPGGEAAQPE